MSYSFQFSHSLIPITSATLHRQCQALDHLGHLHPIYDPIQKFIYFSICPVQSFSHPHLRLYFSCNTWALEQAVFIFLTPVQQTKKITNQVDFLLSKLIFYNLGWGLESLCISYVWPSLLLLISLDNVNHSPVFFNTSTLPLSLLRDGSPRQEHSDLFSQFCKLYCMYPHLFYPFPSVFRKDNSFLLAKANPPSLVWIPPLSSLQAFASSAMSSLYHQPLPHYGLSLPNRIYIQFSPTLKRFNQAGHGGACLICNPNIHEFEGGGL